MGDPDKPQKPVDDAQVFIEQKRPDQRDGGRSDDEGEEEAQAKKCPQPVMNFRVEQDGDASCQASSFSSTVETAILKVVR